MARTNDARESSKGEARNYSWEPFNENNTAAMKHGGRSPRQLRPIAENLTSELIDVSPWLGSPLFRSAIDAWAWAEASCVLFRQWFTEGGLWTEDGELRAGLDMWDRYEKRAATLRDKIGLDPSAWTRLVASMAGIGPEGADALDQMLATGRELLAQRDAKALDDGVAE